MYTRIAEFQSTSKVNCDMIIAFFQNVMITRYIKNGKLSCEVFRVSETLKTSQLNWPFFIFLGIMTF